jgi:hypothetical protein
MRTNLKSAIVLLLVGLFGFSSVVAQDKNFKMDGTYDENIHSKSRADLEQRYPGADLDEVSWHNSSESEYSAYYQLDGRDYMTKYDREGNWKATLEKKEWNDEVPEYIQTAYNDTYSDYDLESYWEVNEYDDDNLKGSGILMYRDENDRLKSAQVLSGGVVEEAEEYPAGGSANQNNYR